MKLRKRFWGILGSLAFVAGGVQAGDTHANDFSTLPSKSISQNQQVANEVAAAIAREVPDRGYSVSVQFRGGVAILSGNASSPTQLHRILQAARLPSVQRVVNEMQVGSGFIQTVAYQEPAMPPAPEMPAPAPGQVLAPATPEYTFPQGAAPQYDAPFLPPFAWPARAPYPNYTAVQYPRRYASYQWPYIGPFHPYPEPPLDWRCAKLCTYAGLKPCPSDQDPPPDWHCVKLRWEDGHWYLSFKDAWWARGRDFLCNIGHPQCDDVPIGCGTCLGDYRVCFPQPHCTHKFMNY
jgi:BON domain